MTESPKSHPTWGGVPLTRRGLVLGMAAVGGFLAVDLGAVAWAGGWIDTAHRLTPDTFIKAFAWVNGKQSGFRKNHAKGAAVAGYFESNGNGSRVVQRSRVPVGTHAGAWPLLAGGRQRPCRRRGSDGTRARPGVRISRRRRSGAPPC